MEKPDSSGYVNVLWPSKNVPHGGIFHTRNAAQLSQEQNQLQKILSEEAKLNMKLQQTRVFGLRAEEKKLVERSPVVETVRPRTSRRRSLSAIRSSGILDVDMYRPLKRGEDRERMKERLANNMAYGESTQQVPLYPPPQRQKKQPPKLPTTKERWNDLVTQIRERAEWLAEMEWLGEAAPHREIVQEQIEERMRALDALGVDSTCSTARSSIDSVVRSSARSVAHSTGSSGRIPPSAQHSEMRPSRVSAAARRGSSRTNLEENVMMYNKFSPLRYSPRRRV